MATQIVLDNLNSSALDSVVFEGNTAEVTFTSGAVYNYLVKGDTETVAADMAQAPSIGRSFNQMLGQGVLTLA